MLRLHSIFSDSFPFTERIAFKCGACDICGMRRGAGRPCDSGMAQKDELPYAPARRCPFFGLGSDRTGTWRFWFPEWRGREADDMSP